MFIIIGGDGKEYGPVTTDQVRAWIEGGRADLDTRAKRAGTDEWRRLGEFPEFGPAASVPPPMRPDPVRATLRHEPAVAAPMAETSELASRGARTGAALLNAFFYLICTIPGSVVMSRKMVEQYPELAEGRFPNPADIDVAFVRENLVWVLAGLGAGLLLQAALIALRGQNLGKMITGVRVVRADTGEPAGAFRGAFLRFLGPVIIMLALHYTTGVLGILLLIVDYCFMFRADQRCLHDLIAGTKVVRA
jgi:hypothetical protein